MHDFFCLLCRWSSCRSRLGGLCVSCSTAMGMLQPPGGLGPLQTRLRGFGNRTGTSWTRYLKLSARLASAGRSSAAGFCGACWPMQEHWLSVHCSLASASACAGVLPRSLCMVCAWRWTTWAASQNWRPAGRWRRTGCRQGHACASLHLWATVSHTPLQRVAPAHQLHTCKALLMAIQ